MPNAGSLYAAEPEPANQTGFLVVAADRGFVGNEEIRDAFTSFSASHPAELIFVTDERTRQTLQRLLPKGAVLNSFQIEPQQLAMWMEREANRNLPLAEEDIGVILFAHGSDFHWNENLRLAVEPLTKRYKTEFAFSMADPYTIERALRKLEQRGAKTAIVISAFASHSSYRNEIGYLTGLDIEDHPDDHTRDNSGHSSHGGHGGHAQSSAPVPRILTSLPVIWTGGYEDNPLFARALFDRVLALSKDPARETVILTAHGTQDDRKNDEWLQKLNSIANQMHAQGGQKFRAFKVATWREDWPDKRVSWINKVRAMVIEAGKQGGRAIVIPARTTAVGPKKRFLAGLEFELGEGFAPHPLFTQWVDEQIHQGLKLHEDALIP